MRILLSILGLCSLLLTGACTPATPAAPEQPAPPVCQDLGQLLQRIAELDSLLEASAAWPNITAVLDVALEALADNMKQDTEECNYLNLQHFPDQPRFLFVDALAYRSLRDTLPEGIYYLLRLRGIFSEDPAISEFFSEELARMALNNPACYLAYLQENPDQEVMLLYSTKWNFLDADLLIDRFSKLTGAAPIVRYLQEWKIKQSVGGR